MTTYNIIHPDTNELVCTFDSKADAHYYLEAWTFCDDIQYKLETVLEDICK